MREIATVATTGLNLHTRPDRKSHLTDQLQSGDEAYIIARNGTWFQVKVTKTKTGIGVGEYGWLDGHYVTIRQELDEPRPRPQPAWRPFDVLLTWGSAAAVGLLVLWGAGKLSGWW